MDQLFDRFGNLIRSWVQPDPDVRRPFSDPFQEQRYQRTGDSFFDEAMDELDAFLRDDTETQQRLRRDQEARNRQRYEQPREAPFQSGPPPKLQEAYRSLGLQFGATFDQVRAAYKRLLKEHHPDKHGSSPETIRKATETSARINNAYRIIETWHQTGTLGDE
ncbi:MAG: J domain-containing protein [Spirochaetales bacterium]|nr:J domain-containing protein [Spirochaetales bacterium]